MARRPKKTPKATPTATRLELRAAAIAACRDAAGRVTPKAVWQAARDPAHPLHNDFQWDLSKAAERDWERTAAELIRSVKFIVVYEDTKLTVPFYVSDPRTDESSYYPTVRVAKNGTLSKRVLQDELSRIKAAVHRAMKLAATFGLISSFERMLDQAIEIERDLGSRGDDDEEGDDAR